ncbi:aminoacyl-tRNA deacylase [Thalassovita sp.]|jgi:Cys-tRNA(Pro)/Cys-tRNA(Cys) deacylase|uniref:aminoacyl-tRNA deacylase n=1 Tax=Thalassovita sp. TaxID=1979401 RepID=UPI003B58E3EB
MSTATPATRYLAKQGLAFEVLEYTYAPGKDRVGLQAAEAIGMPADHVFKTLMVEVDGKPACVVIPSDQTVSMKRAAAAFGGKSAKMMDQAKAERLTGYHTGGISPFGQKKRVPVAVHECPALDTPLVVNGGKRGMMLRLDLRAAAQQLNAQFRPLCA